MRGGFRTEGDEVPGARAVVLLGVVGASCWPAFAASPEASDGAAHPLDRWSRRVVTGLAERFEARALFPFEGPPFFPFQRWALRAEPVAASPLGLLIHPRYGLWHSYRGALAFAHDIELPEREAAASPCATCEARPCLTACPVGAFTPAGYDVETCADWLRQPQGRACREGGCLARRACPVGREYTQVPEQARVPHARIPGGARGLNNAPLSNRH